jgi:hypothetical protein
MMQNVTRSRRDCWSEQMRAVFSIAVIVVLGSFMGGSLMAQDMMVEPSSIDFGKVLVDGSSVRSLMISNEGTEDLVVSSITVDNPAFGVDPTSMTLPADSSASVSVTFTPESEGSMTGILTISSNDPAEPTVEVPLNGTGATLEAVVSVADGYGDPGTSGNKVSIVMENTIDVAGLNFTLNFDPSILEPTDVVPTERTADMSIFNSNLELGPGQAILVIADLEGDPIPVGTGAIATFYFNVAPEVSLGEYPLTLTEIVLSDTAGQAVLIDVDDGAFHVTGPSTAAWDVSITATSTEPEVATADLLFGADPAGTDGFDPQLDKVAPPRPPGAEFWAYFSIEGTFSELSEDIRSSLQFTLTWTLVTGGTGGTLTWDTEALPDDAILMIDEVDMSSTGSMDFDANETFTITYEYQDQTPPADVTDLQGLAADQQALLYWTGSPSQDLRGYMVYVDSAGVRIDEIDVGDVTTYTVTGLANLFLYTFTVTAYDEVGNESPGVSVDVRPNPKSFAIMLTLGSIEHTDTVRVFFGGDQEGTDDFDAGLDFACPPPPPPPVPELVAYFPIDHPSFDRLCTEIRSSLQDTVIWTLVTEGSGGEICWDQEQFPSGVFVLVVPGVPDILMKEVTCATFSAGDTLKIYFYQKPVSVEPYRETLTPEQYELVQNYPNPFNPETTIEYRIPESNQVKLEIFNVLGQHVRTLFDGRQEAGYYNIIWDGLDSHGSPASSGVYFYRVQAGAFSATKPMLLLK